MTDVAQHLKDLIRANGPMSIATFMQTVLTGRADSYYRRADPLGASGDFVTAPEISQAFGELIGLWCVDVWLKLGSPAPVTLVELGPGRGTLMKDALRAARVAPAFLDAASIALVEVSEALRRVQRDTLGGANVRWYAQLEDVETVGPVIVVANEFFDALPIRQLVRMPRGWAERCVGLDARGELIFGVSGSVEDLVPSALREVDVGAVVEISPSRSSVAQAIGARVAASSGAALAIDYGYAGPAAGDTLQAVRAHAFAEVLAEPGTADLTAHVDFSALGQAFADGGAHVGALATQGGFLNRLGARARVDRLKRGVIADRAELLDAGYRRLTETDAMGSLFKVLCAVWPASIQPAGFSGT